jgi:hypothetical protein
MDRGLVGTEGNEDTARRGDYKTAGERTTGLLVSDPRSVVIGLWLKKSVTSAKFHH